MPVNIAEIERRLWRSADQLRANSGLRPSEYSRPVLGLLFLRYAEARFADAEKALKSTTSVLILYQSGRCAIAHAGANPTVDPENPEELERLAKDLPVIRALAARAIEHELGVKSRHQIWLEHLYELAGFKELIGGPIADRLKAMDNSVKPNDLAGLSKLSVRIQKKDPYSGLENLNVRVTQINNGVVNFSSASDHGHLEFDMALNFPNERIDFELWTGLRLCDSGTERAARDIVSGIRFIVDYLGNSKLQIYDPHSNTLLGRKDAYIPMNIDLPRTMAHYRNLIEQFEAEAETRALKAQG